MVSIRFAHYRVSKLPTVSVRHNIPFQDWDGVLRHAQSDQGNITVKNTTQMTEEKTKQNDVAVKNPIMADGYNHGLIKLLSAAHRINKKVSVLQRQHPYSDVRLVLYKPAHTTETHLRDPFSGTLYVCEQHKPQEILTTVPTPASDSRKTSNTIVGFSMPEQYPVIGMDTIELPRRQFKHMMHQAKINGFSPNDPTQYTDQLFKMFQNIQAAFVEHPNETRLGMGIKPINQDTIKITDLNAIVPEFNHGRLLDNVQTILNKLKLHHKNQKKQS